MYEQGVIKQDEYDALQKVSLKLLEFFCVFGYWEFYKILLSILVEAYKTIHGMNTTIPNKLMENFHLSSPGMIAHVCVNLTSSQGGLP